MIRQPMLTLACAVLFSLAAGAVQGKHPEANSLDLENFVTQPAAWDLSPSGLRQQSRSKFQQGLCTTELMYSNRGDDAFKFLGMPVAECVARLNGDRLKNFYILLRYTKDPHAAGRIKAAHSAAEDALIRLCRGPGQAHEFTWEKGEKIAIRQWKTSAGRVRLYTNEGLPFGYVSVLVERADLPERDMAERLHVSARHLPEKIVDGSSVYLAVPMRAQLPGIGACWSATLARQLAYLGSEIEPQMAAQMTVPKEEKQLRHWAPKLGFVVKTYDFFGTREGGQNAVNLLLEYNRIAAHHGVPPIKYTETAEKIVFVDGFRQMDARWLKEIPPARRDRDKYAEFRTIVTTFVDRSIPVSWTVTRWRSKDGKGGGRHRRMIIGYDPVRDLVFYSDPWGFHGERQSMPTRAAYAMTLWMQAICPHSMAHLEIAASHGVAKERSSH